MNSARVVLPGSTLLRSGLMTSPKWSAGPSIASITPGRSSGSSILGLMSRFSALRISLNSASHSLRKLRISRPRGRLVRVGVKASRMASNRPPADLVLGPRVGPSPGEGLFGLVEYDQERAPGLLLDFQPGRPEIERLGAESKRGSHRTQQPVLSGSAAIPGRE